MIRLKMIVAVLFAALLLTSASLAQETLRNEVSVQGTGFLTRDSESSGIKQHTTDSTTHTAQPAAGFVIRF